MNPNHLYLSQEAADLGVTRKMLERSAVPFGNNERIASLLSKAAGGHSVTVGIIGGSISQGVVTTSYEKCYPKRLEAWWKENFPQAEITLVNAGLGSTDSVLGVHRLEQDLLKYRPDFVVVEFAANDSQGLLWAQSYEAMIRRIWESPSKPGIMLMFMNYQDGTTEQNAEIPIGTYYQLPMISYHDAVKPEIAAGRLKWNEISPDIVHPNDRGHGIAACLITTMLDSFKRRLPDKDIPISLPVPMRPLRFMDARLIHSGNCRPEKWGSFHADFGLLKPHYPLLEDCWVHYGSGDEPLRLENVSADTLFLIYRKAGDEDNGIVRVTVDDNIVTEINTKYDGGDYAAYEQIYSGSASKHNITLQPVGGKLVLLGIMASG